MNLPQIWERKIQQIILENKQLYEPWIESAENYIELRQRLKERGFSDLAMGPNPLLNMEAHGKPPKADTSSCEIKRTMLRRNR